MPVHKIPVTHIVAPPRMKIRVVELAFGNAKNPIVRSAIAVLERMGVPLIVRLEVSLVAPCGAETEAPHKFEARAGDNILVNIPVPPRPTTIRAFSKN